VGVNNKKRKIGILTEINVLVCLQQGIITVSELKFMRTAKYTWMDCKRNKDIKGSKNRMYMEQNFEI
jgi:hypothetical protein